MSGSFFVLDGMDERKHKLDGKHWRHRSTMDNNHKDSVTFSYAFCVVKMQAEVTIKTDHMAKPRGHSK